jgi:uncharacterized protein involved in type VI secretion and phage assembly
VNTTPDRELQDAIDRLRHRYFGKYPGTVVEVDATTMQIKAKVPAVLGEQPTSWCRPCVPYAGNGLGLAFLPDQGSGVWIEFVAGDVSCPIWSGAYWHDGEQPTDATATVKAIVTKAGKILFDTESGNVTVTDGAGSTCTLDANGVTIERDGKKIVVSGSSVSVNDGALEVT